MATSGPGNTRLKGARQGAGLRSQQALADAVTRTARSIGLRISVTARTVRRWESDSPPWPHLDHQAALEALFRRPITDLGFTPPWRAAPAGHRPADEPADRDAFVAVPPGAGAWALASFPARPAAATLPASVASDYISITAAHRNLYWQVPATRLHKPVAAHAYLGMSLLPGVPEAARASLAAAVSEASLLAGRLEGLGGVAQET